MILKEAEQLAKDLMTQYKVNDYTFDFNISVSTFGWCSTEKKTITLSPKLTELNTEEEVRQVILHEIAHALTPGCAHNEIWRRVNLAIGGDGQRCYDEKLVEQPTHKWVAKCPNCKREVKRHKKNPRLHCGKCIKENGGRFKKDYKFKWIKNK